MPDSVDTVTCNLQMNYLLICCNVVLTSQTCKGICLISSIGKQKRKLNAHSSVFITIKQLCGTVLYTYIGNDRKCYYMQVELDIGSSNSWFLSRVFFLLVSGLIKFRWVAYYNKLLLCMIKYSF